MADPVNDSIQAISGVSSRVTSVLNKIVVAVLILLIGLIIGKLLGNLIRRALNEVRLDRHLRASLGFKFSMEKAVSSLVSYFIYFAAIVMSLNSLGLTTAILNMLSAGVIVIIVASFILAVKDFFPNFIAGVRLKNKKMFSEGDKVQIKEVEGVITSIGFLETRLRTAYDEEVIMPNSIFSKRQIIVKKKMTGINRGKPARKRKISTKKKSGK